MTGLPQPRGHKPSANPAPTAHRWEFCATGVRLFAIYGSPSCRKEGKPDRCQAFPPSVALFPLPLREIKESGKSATTANLRPCCWHIEINSWRYPKDTTFTSEKDDEPGRRHPFGRSL